jgi:hypothetical protein
VSSISIAQDNETTEKYAEKVKTLDSTIATLYAVISGDAGVKRDWNLFRYLFKEDAKLIPSGANKEGKVDCKYMSPDDYITSSGSWLEENGFFEKEIHREIQQFSNMTHVFSTYASFRASADETPFMRGINSIQLLNDGERWWIINIYWTGETENAPLPSKYLGK